MKYRNMNSSWSKIFFLIILLFFSVCLIHAQENKGYLNINQLIKLQKSSIDDIRMYLNNESWSFDDAKSNQSFKFFDYPLSYDFVSWEKSSYHNGEKVILYNSPGKPNIVIYQSNSFCFRELLNSLKSKNTKTKIEEDKLVTIFKENSITIEFREYKNDYSSRQYSILVYNPSALLIELQTLKEIDNIQKKLEAEKKLKYNNALENGNKLFESGKYDEAKLQFIIAEQLFENELVESKIELCNDAICEKIVAKGDSAYSIFEYNNALKYYIHAKSCSKPITNLEEKINLTNKRIIEQKVANIQKTADLYYKENKFDQAINSYNSILAIDKTNHYATQRIEDIQKIKNLLAKRSMTVFSYKEINSTDYYNFKTDLLNKANNEIDNYKKGLLEFNYTISFDTLGINRSFATLTNSTIKGYDTYLSNICNNESLKPSIESGYYLTSKESVGLKIKWETQKIMFKSTSKGIYTSSNVTAKINDIESFINNQSFKYGKYTFEVKQKEINNNSFIDVNLTKYKVVGPESAFYSILMPGMGDLKVTYGEKGWGRFAAFLISSCISVGSNLYSNAQYKNYLGATTQTDIDKYYNNANISHQISLVSAGISASIYLYDIIWVFTKGIKNQKESSHLRKQLQEGSVLIQKQTIELK